MKLLQQHNTFAKEARTLALTYLTSGLSESAVVKFITLRSALRPAIQRQAFANLVHYYYLLFSTCKEALVCT